MQELSDDQVRVLIEVKSSFSLYAHTGTPLELMTLRQLDLLVDFNLPRAFAFHEFRWVRYPRLLVWSQGELITHLTGFPEISDWIKP